MFPLSEATRGWIYRILLAAQPLVVAYGLIADNMATLWVSVASAILGLGLASAKTSIQSAGKHVAEDEAK